ncbi:SulP family inorganic anion transporter [Listeria monocytogenes]|uniref:SulP family inorganic anion transporter n=1 Tax=Listeria monocytogenes TaxID=1639 RepID=A0AAN3BF83_LISMN|nr:SulP family inorganic anion transporter [Listeria monocytogenes]EAC3367817.1 SulP family inorganic anion transporter [Listeria monocytogenes]EAC7086918.1 SulP family inorganic anion transporter [Listeria monocytogenes]EAC8542072.1 SulP family inorganic anion transporter [Listeria monocytogenes]EAC8548074.1 SulP family inorganic anion transporter [Listeria monocytogenes]
MLISFNKNEWLGNIKNDILGGLVTSIALIPEVIGFAIIAGVNPITALFASVTTAIVTSITGGRPAMVSAAAGSMALVMVTLIKNHGLEYMIAATILTGIIQLILGYLGIHKLMKYISKPVMLGFVNALAILIFLAQVQQLGNKNLATYVMVGATILIMYIFPKISKSFPPALIVIIVMSILSLYPSLGLQTVGDLGDMTGSLPLPSLPSIPFTLETFLIIFPTSLALSMVGLIESLLTLPLINDMTDSTGDNKREVKAQGLANIFTGFFGGPAGCAMIGQAVINVKSGGRKRLSTLTAGLALLFLIVALKGVMIQIPTAALIGIMITVAFETFDWESVKLIRKKPIAETIIMIITISIVVYTHNLAIGILVGVVLSMIVFITKASKLEFIKVDETIYISGQLFFASASSLIDYFNNLSVEENMTVDLSRVHIWDESGIEALNSMFDTLEKNEASIQIVGIRTTDKQLINRIDQLK